MQHTAPLVEVRYLLIAWELGRLHGEHLKVEGASAHDGQPFSNGDSNARELGVGDGRRSWKSWQCFTGSRGPRKRVYCVEVVFRTRELDDVDDG
jgi:hypothetical protein